MFLLIYNNILIFLFFKTKIYFDGLNWKKKLLFSVENHFTLLLHNTQNFIYKHKNLQHITESIEKNFLYKFIHNVYIILESMKYQLFL